MTEESSTSSVHRAMAILTALGSREAITRTSLGVTEVARLVGREKSQVSRALKVLDEAGFVDRDPDTLGYRLGWRLFTLAANAGEQRLLALAPSVLRHLVNTVHESAHLNVLEGGTVLTVLSESPLRAVQAVSWVGRTTPVHCTASGRALLFDYSDADIHDLLRGTSLVSTGPKAPRDVDTLLTRLRRARSRGYTTVNEEWEPGLVAGAAPVRDSWERVVAAVSVSAPKFRLRGELDQLGRQVKTAADKLAADLGGQPAPDQRPPVRHAPRTTSGGSSARKETTPRRNG